MAMFLLLEPLDYLGLVSDEEGNLAFYVGLYNEAMGEERAA